MFLDADTHVYECTETWDYLPKSMEPLRPSTITISEDEIPGYLKPGFHRGWFIDGQVFNRQIRSENSTTTEDIRTLRDVPGRIKDMDNLAVDSQVIYPTLFLNEVTHRPELELALCQSYNRWISDRCAESGGRLRWVMLPPVRSMENALAEIRHAKENGACGIFKRGIECDDRHVSDPYFYPLYELAQDLDMPICCHTARPWKATADLMTSLQRGMQATFYLQDAFLSVLTSQLYAKFPTLRYGFLEAGSGWIPHLLWAGGFDPMTNLIRDKNVAGTRERYEQILADGRLFVTCEVSENIAAIISQIGDNNLIVGSDYGHNDRAAIWGVHNQIFDLQDLSAESSQKLTSKNAETFYRLG